MPTGPEDVRALALMLPEVIEGAHRGNADFRVGRRVFATLWTEEERVVVKLTPGEQAMRVEAEPEVFEPIPGSWGSRGWSTIDLIAAEEEVLRGALLASWRTVAPAEVVARYTPLMLAEERGADDET